MWKCLLFTFLFFLPVVLYSQEIVRNNVIWKGNPYSAFTSLVFYKGHYYCAFRNAKKHYDPSGEDCGSIIIIRSKDAVNWEEFLCYSVEHFDLRDPQLTIDPRKHLLLLTQKVQYQNGTVLSRQSCISFINVDGSFTALSPVEIDASPNWHWLWNISWINGRAYGFAYNPFFGFVESKDGVSYKLLKKINLDEQPTEASIIKMRCGKFLAVVRRTNTALIGIYDKLTKNWEWKDTGLKIGCPKLIKIRGEIYLLGRSYGKTKQTSLYIYDKTKVELKQLLGIDGDKDCAYPGAVYRNKRLYVSYYSGDGKTGDIYLAEIKL